MNFLYCFDNNFNLQALNSINSIINKSKIKNLNFYIIHDSPSNFSDLIEKYLSEYINIITIFKFDFDSIDFPKITDAHVSKATYFRLFFQKYLPEDIEFITYVDSDIICMRDPERDVIEAIKNIKDNNLFLGAVNDGMGTYDNQIRLDMKSDKYFNAGVMVINLKEWRANIQISKILLLMEELREKILWWDQDILNVLIDGDYLELTNDFNKKTSDFDITPEKSVIFVHYSGKGKPWSPMFYKEGVNMVYQNEFLKTGFSKFHIAPKGFKENVLFFRNLISGKYVKFNISDLIKSYIKNKIK